MKILYLPLDERPCNLRYPQDIAKSNSDIEILTLDKSELGLKKKKTDLNIVKSFILNNISECDAAIISIDMLCYGGLIPSRIHNEELADLIEHLNLLKEIKKNNPKVKIYAFNAIMRTPSYNSDDEEPKYYKNHGYNIFRKKYLEDKINKNIANLEERTEFGNIEIPSEITSDYEERREKNSSLNLEVLNLVQLKIIDSLVIFQDDSAPYGYTANDQRIVKNQISKLKIGNHVHIYPGADEVGCSLLLKAYNEYKHIRNNVYVEYNSEAGKAIIPLYEDRPMYETLKSHLLVTENLITNNYQEADYILMVNNPGEVMQESWDQWENRLTSYDTFRNIKYFVEKIKYFTSIGKKVIVADVAYANGGDYDLLLALDSNNLLDKIYGYGAWNTHANTLGTVIAQGMISDELSTSTINNTINHIIEDTFYQARLRKWITNEKLPSLDLDYFNLKNKQNEIVDMEVKLLSAEYEKLNISYKYPIKTIHLSHPWNRMFEIDLTIELVK